MSFEPPPTRNGVTRAEFSPPRVAEIAQVVEPISPETPVLELLALFHKHQDLSAVPLVDGERHYLGIVSRRPFLTFMSRAYAREVYTRKPVSAIVAAMPELTVAPVSPKPSDRVDQVLVEYLSRDPEMFYDALPVIAEQRILGIVPISDMMLSLSESQAELLAAVQALSERLKREVALAAQLQRQLLPPADIVLPGLRGLATLLTSSEVGGDYYDCYSVDGRYAVLMIGDVSGHGVASGTLVSAVKAGANLLAAEAEYQPEKILARLNLMLLNASQQMFFMTLFVASLDTVTGRLCYANAGHQFPYVLRHAAGSPEMLETGGLPLGKSATAHYAAATTELGLGDRIFFYTDGLLEEPDASGEPFGYDRLETLLRETGRATFAELRDRLLDELTRHAAGNGFEDDVTLFCVEYHQRPATVPEQPAEPVGIGQGLVRLIDSWYRANDEAISPYASRQTLVFLADSEFSDLLPRFSRDGIRRVLPRHEPFIQRLGWDHLINQHLPQPAGDLAALVAGEGSLWRDFHLVHSEDKSFVMREAEAFLDEAGVDADHLEPALLLVDELLENGLYAAPKNGKGFRLYAKGESRALVDDESLNLAVVLGKRVLAISVADNWGTLTPATFLNRLARHVEGDGLIPGLGGAGLYLVWRISDYLQIRVYPHKHTEITALFDLTRPVDTGRDKGFQFLYHSEVHEATSHVVPLPADSGRKPD